MARTNIPVVSSTTNAGVQETAGTAIDQANGMKVSAKRFNKLQLVILYTTAPASNTILRAGANPPGLEAGQGDLTVTGATGAGNRMFIGPFVGGRFAQANGDLNVDFASTTAGTIWAYELARPNNTD
jgi:hypothetical protein